MAKRYSVCFSCHQEVTALPYYKDKDGTWHKDCYERVNK